MLMMGSYSIYILQRRLSLLIQNIIGSKGSHCVVMVIEPCWSDGPGCIIRLYLGQVVVAPSHLQIGCSHKKKSAFFSFLFKESLSTSTFCKHIIFSRQIIVPWIRLRFILVTFQPRGQGSLPGTLSERGTKRSRGQVEFSWLQSQPHFSEEE